MIITATIIITIIKMMMMIIIIIIIITMIVIGNNKIIIKNSYIYIYIPNIWCQIRKCFLSVISILQRLDKFEKGCSSVGIGMTSGFKNIIHICRTPAIKPMWSILFKFKQKQIHLFSSVCIFFFRFLINKDTKPNTHSQNEVVLLHYREVYGVVETEIYFSYTKFEV